MDPVLEVKPSACLILLGPQLTAGLVNSKRMLSFKTLLESAVKFLQQRGADNGSMLAAGISLSELEQQGCTASMQKVVQILRDKSLYTEWLQIALGSVSHTQSYDFPDSLQWLLELQQMGAMLACTQYDTLLDDLAGQKPAILCSNDLGFLKWLKSGGGGDAHTTKQPEAPAQRLQEQQTHHGRPLPAELNGLSKSGILHLHGVHTVLDSISLLPYRCKHSSNVQDDNEEGVADSKEGVTDLTVSLTDDHLTSLRDVFQKKLVLLLGFDGDHSDPLLPSLLSVIYEGLDLRSLKNPPILLTSSLSPHTNPFSSLSAADIFLRLFLPSPENLRDVIMPGSSRNFAVGKFSSV